MFRHEDVSQQLNYEDDTQIGVAPFVEHALFSRCHRTRAHCPREQVQNRRNPFDPMTKPQAGRPSIPVRCTAPAGGTFGPASQCLGNSLIRVPLGKAAATIVPGETVLEICQIHLPSPFRTDNCRQLGAWDRVKEASTPHWT